MTDAKQNNSQPVTIDGVDPRLRFLKGLVIFLAVLLVVGFAAVVATIVYRIGDRNEKPEASQAEALPPVTVDLPEGARLVNVLNYRGELALQVAFPDGHQAIMMLDTNTGNLAPLAEIR